MINYRLDGFRLQSDDSDLTVGVADVSFYFIVPEEIDSFTYSYEFEQAEFTSVIIDASGFIDYRVMDDLDNVAVTSETITSSVNDIFFVEWGSGKKSFIYNIEVSDGLDYGFLLGGDSLPEFNTVEAANDFLDSITNEGKISSGDFAPNQPVSFDDLTELSEADDDNVITGTSGMESLKGGSGNDLLISGVSTDLSDTAGAQIYRVYKATLDRAPDAGGFEGWTNQLESGSQSLQQIVTGFVSSAEFQNTYGSLDNNGFVTLLYNNVLDRDPDIGGLNGWVNAMNSGLVREQVVTGFSESTEFKGNTSIAASAYAEAIDGRAQSAIYDDVFRLYQATLDRAPDLAGLEGWSGQLAGGQSYTAVAAGFTGSAEFSAAYGNLDNGAFVDQLYRNVLDREADAGGREGWVGLINNGGTREDVVEGFAQSVEFIDKTAASFKAYMKATGGDVLDGGADSDTLYGGLTADTFVFDADEDGTDAVLQLDIWDTLQFEDFGYSTAADALAKMSAAGSDVLFADQGVTIVFSGADLATMQEVDYLFA